MAQPGDIGIKGMEDDSVITDEFVVSRRQMLSGMFLDFGIGLFAFGLGVVFSCLLVGCLEDLRFIILGLMIGMIMMPAIAAYLYFSYGLRPECFVNVLPHTVTFSPGEVTVTLFIEEKGDDEQVEASADNEKKRRTVVYTFGVDLHRPIISGAKSMRIMLSDGYKGFIYVPYSAFADDDMGKKACNILIDYNPKLCD